MSSKPIKEWFDDEKPREKLINNGPSSLSNSEILAIIISSGYKNKSALDLAKEILEENDNSIDKLANMTIDELKEIKGIGYAKAITIVAALELAKRRNVSNKVFPKFNDPAIVYNHISHLIKDLSYEEFWVIYLNNSLNLIKKVKISQGAITTTIVDLRIILKKALLLNSTYFILCHNHPSGNHEPSIYDIQLTKDIVDAAKFFNIKVLDHIIICQNSYYSFKEHNKI